MGITEKEFTEIMGTINQNWMVEMETSEEKLKVEGSEWYKNRGIILCQDEFSRKWVQKSIEGVEIGGRQFKACQLENLVTSWTFPYFLVLLWIAVLNQKML